MRHSNQTHGGRRLPVWAVGLFVLTLVGCASTPAASGTPAPLPAPTVTLDPHLTEPVTADQIFRALGSAGLPIVASNANSGNGNRAIVKQINAEIGSWPLRITEYTSAAALAKATGWKPGQAPARNQAPYGWAALNVAIEFGPINTAGVPKAPPPARQELAAKIVAALDPLLWPLLQHSVVEIPARTAAPAAPASGRPTRSASAAPSRKP
jgi:hypothetical protein